MTDPKTGTEPKVHQVTSIEEFTKIFGDRFNTEAVVTDMASRFLKYGGSFQRIGPDTLEDYNLKVSDRVKYEPGDEPEDNPELVPGDVGSVVGISWQGVIVRWDRLGKDIPVYIGELDNLGILEELADLASDKESYPMTKRTN